METMKGKRWERMLAREKSNFHRLSSQPLVERLTHHMEKEIEDTQQYLILDGYTIGGGAVDIIIKGSSDYYWKWSWGKKLTAIDDIDVIGTTVWYTTKNDKANYDNRIVCEDSTGKHLWTKSNVSFQVAVIAPYCYYVKVLNYFTAVEVCVCDAYTGKNERILYREHNDEKDLVLYKTANRTLYFKSEDPNESQLYEISGLEITQLYKNSKYQQPLGNGCVLVKSDMKNSWTPHGTIISEWGLPSEEIIWTNITLGLVLTMMDGGQTIWHCAHRKKPQVIYKIKVGSIEPEEWSQWEQSVQQMCIVKVPFQIPFLITIMNHRIIPIENRHRITHPIDFLPLEIHTFHTPSRDGTMIPYITVKQKGVTPKAQLVYVYGAYGSSTPVNWPYQTWYPLLKRNWLVVFALVRGGGDRNAAWANAARREYRHRSVDDYEAVIRASQQRYHLEPRNTVIYGRSAGGVPVGAIVSRFPDGQLIGAAFTEVPYVDVLRTSSNPGLPLTKGEYKEFGNPRERILNFREMLEVSPINTVPTDGAPGVFVMSHVGLLDKQVYAYESFKWIQHLRGSSSEEETHPKGKYVTFERNEAHQYRPNKMPHFRGVDLAILEIWVEGKLHLE
jgi:protease II